jgi:CRP-like cAMP-binding protein
MPDDLNLARRNRVLAALDEQSRQRLEPDLQPVGLATETVLYRPGEHVPAVYFPTVGVVSVVAVVDDHEIYELATVGHEGMVGLPLVLGGGPPTDLAMIQIPGHGLQMPAERFAEHLAAEPRLRAVLHAYTQTMMGQLGRNGACNRAHNIRQRCARWLLMTADRMDSNRFDLKQEFLAQMLGVRRASVSEAASALAELNCISYGRGVITITDRAALEKISCSCYQVMRDLFDRTLSL